ncbi:MAG: hypothetical protein MUQ10_18685 [Anaerolineae bacterium]|nr:hypothetical protein [Anaerolineae bacterium]
MELRTYVKILIRRWWLVAAPIVVVAAYVLAAYRPPGVVYQVIMRFSTGTQPAGLSEDYDRYYPWLASEYVANGLADVMMTGAFSRALSQRLSDTGIEIADGPIQGAIVTDNAQSIMVVYITWSDPDQIVAIAHAISAELAEDAASYYPQLSDIGPAVRQLDQPRPVPVPPGLRDQLMDPAMRLGLALVVGLAFAFLWHYLDPCVHEASELEELGLRVLTTIPRQRDR